MQLAREPGGRVCRILGPELQAIGPVDGERVYPQSLERLQDRLTRPAEERDTLLDLRGLRRELQQEDVGEWMARAEDRNAQLVAGACELVPELVDLGDGLLEIALVDLVGGHGGGHEVRLIFPVSGPFP